MKKNRRLIADILKIAIGLSVLVFGNMGILDEFWCGMGTALILLGVLGIVRYVRLRTDDGFKENAEVQANDERIKYLRTKAWSWVGYLSVLTAACATIVLKVLGLDEYVIVASGFVCLMMVAYWLCYWILSRKY